MVHVCPLKHELQLINYEANYGCNGCKEPGFGPRYRCELCNYDLHKECMFTNDTCRHDFFRDATFVFMEHPPISPPTITCFLCNACRKPINGFFYHCKDKNLDLHPCCRGLRAELVVDDTTFRLCDEVYSDCLWCNKRKPNDAIFSDGWSYVSECNSYHLHVYCAVEMELQCLNRTVSSDRLLALKKLVQTPGLTYRGNGTTTRRLVRVIRILTRGGLSLFLGDPLSAFDFAVEVYDLMQ